MTKAPVRRNGLFSHSMRGQSIMARKRYLQEHVGAGHYVPTVGKQTGMTSAQEKVLPAFRVGLPFRVKPSGNTLTLRCVFKVIVNLAE